MPDNEENKPERKDLCDGSTTLGSRNSEADAIMLRHGKLLNNINASNFRRFDMKVTDSDLDMLKNKDGGPVHAYSRTDGVGSKCADSGGSIKTPSVDSPSTEHVLLKRLEYLNGNSRPR